MLSGIDRATAHLNAAYTELKESGVPEKFWDMAVDVGSEKPIEIFFGSFGQETGCFLKVQTWSGEDEASLTYGTRRHRQKLWKRFAEIWKEFWAIAIGRDTEYVIHLKPEEITRFKQLLRQMEATDDNQSD